MVPHCAKSLCYQLLPFMFDFRRRSTEAQDTEQCCVIVNYPLLSLIVFRPRRIIREECYGVYWSYCGVGKPANVNSFVWILPQCSLVIFHRIFCVYSHKKCTVYFTDKVWKNNAQAHATSSRPPFLPFPWGLWRRLVMMVMVTAMDKVMKAGWEILTGKYKYVRSTVVVHTCNWAAKWIYVLCTAGVMR